MIAQRLETKDRNLIASQNVNAQSRKEARLNHNNSGQIKNGTINMNELNGKLDSVLMRKKKAQKKAMKVVGDAWAADKKIDLNLEKRRTRIQELKGNIDENMGLIDECNAHKEELRETYEVSADSEEQKDLELLEKRIRSRNPMYNVSLTKEEEERLAEIDKKPLTEYQQRALRIDSDIIRYDTEIDKANEEIKAENNAIRAIKQERLKDHGMVDAQKEAKEIMEDAGKDIIGMLAGEAQDHIDEKLEEKIEDAKEKAEEKEEQEEKLEEQRAEKEEQRAQLEIKQEENREAEKMEAEQRRNAREQADLLEAVGDDLVLPSANASEAKAQIKAMLQRMKLLEEDLKGATVDKKVED